MVNYLPKNNFFYIKIFLALLLAAVFVLNVFQLTRSLGLGGDNQQLIILGESLRSGQGYSLLNLPGNPPANLYPPLYPTAIATALFLTQNTYLPDIIIPLKTLNLIFFLGALIIFYFYLKEKIRNKYIIAAIIILTGLSIQFSPYINEVLTEIPYLFFSMLSVYFVDKYTTDNFNKKYLYLGILFAILCFYTRTIGIALIASIVLLLFFYKKYKEAIQSSLLFILFTLPWFAYSSLLGSQPSYFEQLLIKNPYNIDEGNAHFADFVFRIADNAVYYAQKIPELIFLVNLGSPIISLPLLFITLIGFLKMTGKKINLLHFYIPLYIFILLTWPWTGGRFLIPILPFLIYFFIYGYTKIFSQNFLQPFRKWSILQIAIFSSSITLFFLFAINYIYFDIVKIIKYAPNKNNIIINSELKEVVDFINKEIPENSIIVFPKPYFIYFYTERKSLGYMFTKNKDAIKKYFQENDVSYIIDDNSFNETKNYLQPVIEELIKENKIDLVYRSDQSDFKIYKLK